MCVCACEYACHCAHTLPHTDLHKQNNCGLPVVSHFLELYQNPIVQQHYKATASPDWGLIYVLGSPESAGLSSNLPLIVHQCHSEWMGPLISVRGSGGKQYHASSAFSDNMQKKKKVSLCFHGFQEQSGCKENPYCTQQRQGAGPWVLVEVSGFKNRKRLSSLGRRFGWSCILKWYDLTLTINTEFLYCMVSNKKALDFYVSVEPFIDRQFVDMKA